MSSQHNAHDAVFRQILGEPANAASQLRAVLPPQLVARLDLDQLAQASGSVVDASLQWRHTDLLFTVPLDGHDAFVYVLVEHQSRPDPLMAFRMLSYMVRIWDRFLSHNRGVKRLPPIIPLVVHHNAQAWTCPTELLDVLDIAGDTRTAALDFLPRFRFILDDLSLIDVAALRDRPLTPVTRLALLLLILATGNSNLANDPKPWADQLHAVLDQPGGEEHFRVLVTYIEMVAETPADELYELFSSLGNRAKEVYMTTAEMLRAEGDVKGRANLLVKLLNQKFGPLPNTAVDAIHAATTEQIDAWASRILSATSLDEVLR